VEEHDEITRADMSKTTDARIKANGVNRVSVFGDCRALSKCHRARSMVAKCMTSDFHIANGLSNAKN
jgi:hypothetical protein